MEKEMIALLKFKSEALPPDLARMNENNKKNLQKTNKGEIKIAFNNQGATPSKDGPRINDEILVEKIRCIGKDGEQLGIMETDKAIQLAIGEGLDLVEISPNTDPPVCKFLDYGKYKYEAQKRKNEAKKKQKNYRCKRDQIKTKY